MFSVVGLISVIVFYLLILVVGIWAGRKSKASGEPGECDDVMLAGRNIGLLVGIFTMTATWVGGGYINGTAEVIYTSGLIGCQAPLGYGLSLVLGGVLFAEKMRTAGYVTMLDPFQIRYGERMGGLLFLPALMGEIFWSAAILSALGATLTVILDIPDAASVIASACVAVFYTFFGGLYSVAYTDVVQLACIFVGLWICIPNSIMSTEGRFASTHEDWMGVENLKHAADWSSWIDSALLLTFGGIPWQVYFQRVLSSQTARKAKLLSYLASVGCVIMAIPPVLIGVVARKTDWNKTDFSFPGHERNETLHPDYHKLVLPLVLRHLTPPWAQFIGLGAVSAAVMSSADSSILSAAAMFARNIWKLAIRPGASETEVLRVMKVAVILVGIAATIMALSISSIYDLWFLCGDLVYVILFPQLLCVVYLDKSNTYGSLAGYFVGLLMRILCGEKAFKIPAAIHFPGYDYANSSQKFPFRTFSMILSLLTLIAVSYLSEYLFRNAVLSPRYDVLQCITNIPHDRLALRPENSSLGASAVSLVNTGNRTTRDNGGGGNVNPLHLHPHYNDSRLTSPASDFGDSERKTLVAEKLPLKDKQAEMLSYETMLKD